MTEIVLIVALVSLVAGFGAGWKVNDWKESAAKVAEIKQAQALRDQAQEHANKVSVDFEDKLAKQRVVNRTYYNEVKNETLKTVYSDCVVPDSGRVLLAKSVATANSATGQPDAPVPSVGTTGAAANDGRSAGVVDGSGSTLWGVRFPAWFTGGTGK